MNLKIHTDKTTQSDYQHGCVDISASTHMEAFQLGQVFETIVSTGREVVCTENISRSAVIIRIPLTPAKEKGEP